MNEWAWPVMWIGVSVALAAAIIGGFANYKDPSVECVKAAGIWVPYPSASKDGYCTRKP